MLLQKVTIMKLLDFVLKLKQMLEVVMKEIALLELKVIEMFKLQEDHLMDLILEHKELKLIVEILVKHLILNVKEYKLLNIEVH